MQTRRSQLFVFVMLSGACALAWSPTVSGTASAWGGIDASREAGSPPQAGRVDAKLSRVLIHVDKTGFGHEHAVIGRIADGYLRLGAEHDAGKIVFQMKSFRADTVEARRYLGLEGSTSASTQSEVNQNMLGPAVLNVRKYPTAIYNIKAARRLPGTTKNGHERYRLEGEFTLHGVTRPLVVDAVAVPHKSRVRVRGVFRIKQTDFGITPFRKAFGAVGVANELTIYGDIIVAE